MKHYDDLVQRLRTATKLPMLQALMNEAADAIQSLTAADVRPVVLCKDCKYGQGAKMDFWNEYEGIECIGGVVHRKDWFCADGEKREES